MGTQGPIFEILGGFDEGPIFDDFLSEQKNEMLRCAIWLSHGWPGASKGTHARAREMEIMFQCLTGGVAAPSETAAGAILPGGHVHSAYGQGASKQAKSRRAKNERLQWAEQGAKSSRAEPYQHSSKSCSKGSNKGGKSAGKGKRTGKATVDKDDVEICYSWLVQRPREVCQCPS